MSDNVVLFPGQMRNAPPQNLEEIKEKVRETQEAYIEEFCENLAAHAVMAIRDDGGAFEDIEDGILSVVMVYEAVKSLYLHCVGIEHPLQAIAKSIFVLDAEKQKMIEEITESLNDEEVADDTD